MAEQKTSIWKKEIHLRRPAGDKLEKAAAKATAKRDLADRKQGEKVERGAAKATAKRDLADRKRAEKVERAAAKAAKSKKQAKQANVPAEKSSVWKKEISFRRKAKAARAPAVEAVAAPVSVAPAVEPTRTPAPVASPLAPPSLSRQVPPPVELVAPAQPEPEHVAPPEPVPVAEAEAEVELKATPAPSVEEMIAALSAEEPLEASTAPESEHAEPAVLPFPVPAAVPEPDPEPEDETVVLTPAAVEPPLEVRPGLVAPPPARVASPPAPVAAQKPKRRKRRGSGHRATKVVGLKVGASQIAAARVSNNGSIELHQVAREPLEAGIIVSGELRDPDALAAALKKFFKKHKLPRRGIRLGISNNRIGVRVFEIGGVEDADQLRNAVRFRAQEALPISVDEAVLDFHVVGETVDANGAPVKRVVLVVAYRDLVDRYVTAFRKAGLKLMGIDLEAFALLRALGPEPVELAEGEDRSGLVVVSVGYDRSTFAVSDGDVCQFARVLDWGGETLDTAIVEALEIEPSQAEAVKLQLSLADASLVPVSLTPEQADAARDGVRRAVEAFARDLVSSLRFYQSQPDSLAIRELVLTGGTAEMPGLAAELQRLLDVRVRVGDPLLRLNVGRRVKKRAGLGSYAAAIGLGIED